MKKIIRFTASWCQPCKTLAAHIEQAKIDLPIEVVDIDADMDTAIEYGIRSVPTLVLVEDGTELKRHTGVMAAKNLEDWAK